MKCLICNKEFKKKCNLKLHMVTHSGHKPHKCNQCSKSFFVYGQLARHMRLHTGEKQYSCTQCDKSFFKHYNLTRHMMSHTGEKNHECLVCGKLFGWKSDLFRHMKRHTAMKEFQCSQCYKSYYRKDELIGHLRFHSGEVFKCPQCDKTFMGKCGMNKHIKQVHIEGKPDQPSPSKKTGNSAYITVTVPKNPKDGSKINSFECSICLKTFVNIGTLNRHMNIHSGERPFECAVCMKTFDRKYNLQQHMRIHTGKGAFQCEVCKKRFHHKSNLKVHMRIHTGEKPYKCDHFYYVKEYRDRGSYNRHMSTHSCGEHLPEEDAKNQDDDNSDEHHKEKDAENTGEPAAELVQHDNEGITEESDTNCDVQIQTHIADHPILKMILNKSAECEQMQIIEYSSLQTGECYVRKNEDDLTVQNNDHVVTEENNKKFNVTVQTQIADPSMENLFLNQSEECKKEKMNEIGEYVSGKSEYGFDGATRSSVESLICEKPTQHILQHMGEKEDQCDVKTNKTLNLNQGQFIRKPIETGCEEMRVQADSNFAENAKSITECHFSSNKL